MAGEQIAAKYEYWLRLMTLIHYVGFEICKNILHNIEKLPVNGQQLFLALFREQREFNRLLQKKVLKQDQFDLIFPANGITDITKFDITLFACVITVMFGKQKYKVIVNELKKWRNEEVHQGQIQMNHVDFNNKWNAFLLMAARYGVNAGNFADLKVCAMDEISQRNSRFVYAEILKTRIEHKQQKDLIKIVIIGAAILVVLVVLLIPYLLHFQVKSEQTSLSFERRINASSKMLKKRYIQTIGQQNLKSIHDTYRFKKRFYVELAIVPKNDSVENLPTTSRQFFILNQLNQKGTVTIDQLLNAHKNNNVVLIQGPGGVGKSFTLETAALHWAEGKIWTDVKFVFLLKFRELNLFVGKTFKDSLCQIYEQIFQDLKFKDLENVAEQIVFLLDGIDEFSGLNETLSQQPFGNDISVASGLFILLKSNYFPGRHLLMSGRAFSCEQIRTKFKELSIESYNILGFSKDQVKSYIENYFGPNNTKTSKLIRTIEQQNNVDLMSRTPAFLWSLCELHQQTNAFQEIQTVTPLFTLQLTLFFQHHLHNLNLTYSQSNPIEIYTIPAVQKLVGELSKMAKLTLEEGIVLIDIHEFENSSTIDLLENSGFINRVKTTLGEKIQFHHMLMQEFLTAIFFLRTADFDDEILLNDAKYSGVAPLYAGLQGGCLKGSNSSKYVIDFVTILDLCPKTNEFKRSFADKSMNKENFIDILYEYQNKLDPPMLGVCPYSGLKFETNYLSSLYQSELKSVPSGHYWNESISNMPCELVPKFYIFNNLLEKCDIRKFENVSSYIKECDLKKTADPRHHLLKFPCDFHRFKRSFFQLKKLCTQTLPKFRALEEFLPFVLDFINCTHLRIHRQSENRKRDFHYAYQYFIDKFCKVEFLEKLGHLMKLKTTWKFTHSTAIISELCNSFDSERTLLLDVYFLTMRIFSNIDFKACSEKSFGVDNNATICRGEAVLPCLDYFRLFGTFDKLEINVQFEKQVNESVSERCSAPINFCNSVKLQISQRDKDQRISQIRYFFQKFGSIFQNRVSFLELVNIHNSDDVSDILPYLCNIDRLYFFYSYKYNVKALAMMTDALESCKTFLIDEVLFDYALENREPDYVIANEKVVKKTYTGSNLILRAHTNPGRAVKLLHDNVLNNYALPNFRLKKIRLLTTHLNPHYCKYFTVILSHVKEVEVGPFNEWLFGSKEVESCKETILKELDNNGRLIAFDKFQLQEWKLVVGQDYYYWKLCDHFDLNGREEKLADNQFLPLFLYILVNVTLCLMALTTFSFVYYEEDFDMKIGGIGDIHDLFIEVKMFFNKLDNILKGVFSLILFMLFFCLLIIQHWIPGERLLTYQDPVYYIKDWLGLDRMKSIKF